MGRVRVEGSEAASGDHSGAMCDVVELWLAAAMCLLMSTVLAYMRHVGLVDWAWGAVLAPVWLPFLALMLVLAFALLGDLRQARRERRS